jgi:hypothetical protein
VLGAWAVNNATPLQQELDRAYGVVAEKIVADVFVLDRHASAIDEEPSDVAVPQSVRQELARELDSLRDRGLLPQDVRVRYRFMRYDPGKRFMVFLRTDQLFGLQARILDHSGHEIGRVETVHGTGEVLYPDPVKAAIRRAAADIAAYALGVTRNRDTDSESLDEYGLARSCITAPGSSNRSNSDSARRHRWSRSQEFEPRVLLG